jgi:thymidylate kinase
MNLPLPDKTFLLDLPVSEGLRRAKKKSGVWQIWVWEISFSWES